MLKERTYLFIIQTVCPRSSDPFYIVSYYMKWVTTSWTYSSASHKIFYNLHVAPNIRSMFCIICMFEGDQTTRSVCRHATLGQLSFEVNPNSIGKW